MGPAYESEIQTSHEISSSCFIQPFPRRTPSAQLCGSKCFSYAANTADSPRPVHPPKLPEDSPNVNATNSAVSSTDPQSLSLAFASYIPEEEFTTAELQGYLLLHRKNPEEALQGVSQRRREV
ncbi:hypothetical protein AX17_007432 [Amanita inopinata Kibby_2008]|nr:hypothetical protein AX17_007432 [Amanita inopinata Kibby_2008]